MNKWQKSIHKITMNNLRWMEGRVTYRLVKRSIKKSIRESYYKNDYKELLIHQKASRILSDTFVQDKDMDYFQTEVNKMLNAEYEGKMEQMWGKFKLYS